MCNQEISFFLIYSSWIVNYPRFILLKVYPLPCSCQSTPVYCVISYGHKVLQIGWKFVPLNHIIFCRLCLILHNLFLGLNLAIYAHSSHFSLFLYSAFVSPLWYDMERVTGRCSHTVFNLGKDRLLYYLDMCVSFRICDSCFLWRHVLL